MSMTMIASPVSCTPPAGIMDNLHISTTSNLCISEFRCRISRYIKETRLWWAIRCVVALAHSNGYNS